MESKWAPTVNSFLMMAKNSQDSLIAITWAEEPLKKVMEHHMKAISTTEEKNMGRENMQ